MKTEESISAKEIGSILSAAPIAALDLYVLLVYKYHQSPFYVINPLPYRHQFILALFHSLRLFWFFFFFNLFGLSISPFFFSVSFKEKET